MSGNEFIVVGTFVVVLVFLCITGFLQRSGSTSPSPVGDRVMAGLLALPLIWFLLKDKTSQYAYLGTFVLWVPLFWYMLLLMLADMASRYEKSKFLNYVERNFVMLLIVGVLLIYIVAGIIWTVKLN